MPASGTESVGVIGLGAIGGGVARSMLAAGIDVTGCDISADARARFVADGGSAVETPAELAAATAIVFLFVVNAHQARDVLFGAGGLAKALGKGAVVVSCVTMAPDDAISIGGELQALGIDMLDAPTSGGAGNALKGKTKFMVSGVPDVLARTRFAFDVAAEKVYEIGDKAGQGSTVKVVHQLLTGVHITAAMEAVALGIRLGLDPQVIFDVVTGCAGNSWMFENRVPHVLSGDYTPLSAVEIFVKDLGLVLDTGRQARFPLPLAAAAHQQFLAAAAAGYGREDDAAVIKVYRDLAGLELPKRKG
jgi:putative dehydrogenase